MISSEFARFLIVGAINTAATYVLYLGLLRFFSYLFAYSIAYGAGIVISYFLNSFFVFRTRADVSNFLKFPMIYLVQYLVGAAVLWLCVNQFGVSREFGLVFSIAVSVPVTYIAARFVLKGSLR